MANLTYAQVQQVLANRPEGVPAEDVIAELRARGHSIEGPPDMPEGGYAQPTGGEVAQPPWYADPVDYAAGGIAGAGEALARRAGQAALSEAAGGAVRRAGGAVAEGAGRALGGVPSRVGGTVVKETGRAVGRRLLGESVFDKLVDAVKGAATKKAATEATGSAASRVGTVAARKAAMEGPAEVAAQAAPKAAAKEAEAVSTRALVRPKANPAEAPRPKPRAKAPAKGTAASRLKAVPKKAPTPAEKTELENLLEKSIKLVKSKKGSAASRVGSEKAGAAAGKAAAEPLEKVSETIAKRHGVELRLSPKHTDPYGRKIVSLDELVVPEASRGQGIGSKAMKDLVEAADRRGETLVLRPDPTVRGGVKTKAGVGRLQDFYKRFGFKVNKGRAYDPSISEGMIREPAKAAAKGSAASRVGGSAEKVAEEAVRGGPRHSVQYFSKSRGNYIDIEGMNQKHIEQAFRQLAATNPQPGSVAQKVMDALLDESKHRLTTTGIHIGQ